MDCTLHEAYDTRGRRAAAGAQGECCGLLLVMSKRVRKQVVREGMVNILTVTSFAQRRGGEGLNNGDVRVKDEEVRCAAAEIVPPPVPRAGPLPLRRQENR